MLNLSNLQWTIALGCLAAFLLVGLVIVLKRAIKHRPKPLPLEWALTGRPVFSTDERRIYRLLREALPHHIILSKLPLVRFCQPTDPEEVRYWYELLGTTHVTFAICSANGRVLAAVDLEAERGHSNRAQQIKQAVLTTCRVRYLRCPMDRMPSVAELQLLVPHSGAAARAAEPMPSYTLNQARSSLSTTVAHRRAERTALWQDSALFQDSFFAPDSRLDAFTASDLMGLSDRPSSLKGGEDVAGVVVDAPADIDSRR